MRMLVAVAIALLLIPMVGADPVEVESYLEVHGTAKFNGEVELTGSLQGAVLDSGQGGHGGWLDATIHDAEYELWDYAYIRYVQDDAHPAGGTTWEVVPKASLVEEGRITGTIATGPVQPSHSLRVLPQDAVNVDLLRRGELRIDSYVADANQSYDAMFTPQTLLRHRILPPEGAPLDFADLRIHGEGETVFFVYGANVTLEGESGPRTIETGQRPDEEFRAGHPAAMTEATLIHRYVLVIHARATAWGLSSDEAGGWQLLLGEMGGEWRGDLALTDSRGTGHVNGTNIPAEQHHFHVVGDVNAQARLDQNPSRWHVVGDATYVGVDAVTVAGERPGSVKTEIAVAAGVGLLAVLGLYFTKYGQWLLAWLVGRNETTLTKSPTRVSMLRLICERPGISTPDLARHVGITRQGARLQILRLQAFEAIDSYRRGRIEHHLPNSNTYRYLPSSVVRPDGDAHERVDTRPLFAELNQATRRTIFRVLSETGEAMDYNRIAKHWPRHLLPVPDRRLFHHHAARLAKLGILDAKRRGRIVEYRVAVDLDAVFPLQAAKFLDAHRAYRAAYNAAKDGTRMDAAVARLRAEGFTRTRALKAIDELHAFGFINRIGDALELNRRGVFKHVAPS